MKTSINIIIIILLTTTTYAQKAFNYFDIGNKDMGWSITEGNNGKLFMAGKLDHEFEGQEEGIILRLNSNGNLEKSANYFTDSNIAAFRSIVKDSISGALYAAGKTSNNEIAIMEIDEELNIVSLLKIPCPTNIIIEEFFVIKLLIENENIIAYGTFKIISKQEENNFVENSLSFYKYSNNNDNKKSINKEPFFIKADKCLTEIIEFKYFELASRNYCYQMLHSPNEHKYYAFIGGFPINFVGCNSNMALTVIELDNSFDITDTIGVVSTDISSDYSAISYNGNIVFVGNLNVHFNQATLIKSKNILVKRMTFDDLYCLDSCLIGYYGQDTIVRPAGIQAVCKNDNLCYITGVNNFAWTPTFTHGNEPSEIILSCFDESFNKNWEYYYGIENSYLYPCYITPLTEGGVAITGWKHDLSDTGDDTDFMVLIVDKEGHLTSENSPFVEKSTLCFPSPATSEINIRIAIQHKNCTIEIYNINGKMLKTERANSGTTAINISDFPSGNYIYKVYNSEGFVESGKFVKGV